MQKETYKAGKLDGESIKFTMSEQPIEIKNYKNGLLNGAYKLFKQNGLGTYGDFKEGLKTGPWVEHKFSEGGADEGSYIVGKKNGKWTLGATNLFGKCKGEFIDDLKHGTWDYWKHDGSKWKTEQWDNGVLIKGN